MAARPEPLPVPGLLLSASLEPWSLLPWDGEWIKAALMFLGVCPLQEEAVPCARGECQGCAVEQAPGVPGSLGHGLGQPWLQHLGVGVPGSLPTWPRAGGMDGQRSVLLWSSWRAEGKDKAGSLCGRNSDMAAREAEPPCLG